MGNTRYVALAALGLLWACDSDELLGTKTDGGRGPRFDAGGCPANDPECGRGRIDSGLAAVDTGLAELDAGEFDAGERDAGVVLDAGPTDATIPDAVAFDPPDAGFDAGLTIDAGFDAGPPPPEFLDVSGPFVTHYDLDLSSYLGGINDLAGPLSALHNILTQRLGTGIPALDAAIGDLVANYIPAWVTDVVGVLDNVATFFDVVEIDGRMVLTPGAPISASLPVAGEESWSQAVVLIVEKCPLRRQDPAFPACAKQTIVLRPSTTPVGPLEIGVDVKSFSGELAAGRPSAALQLHDREVQMELYKLVLLMIDFAISAATNGQVSSLQSALNQVIDCAGFESAAKDFMMNQLGMSRLAATPIAAGLGRTCDAIRQDAIDGVLMGLSGIAFDWTAFQFEQTGLAEDTNGDARADLIQRIAVPDTIDGHFQAIVTDRLGGRWSGVRP